MTKGICVNHAIELKPWNFTLALFSPSCITTCCISTSCLITKSNSRSVGQRSACWCLSSEYSRMCTLLVWHSRLLTSSSCSAFCCRKEKNNLISQENLRLAIDLEMQEVQAVVSLRANNNQGCQWMSLLTTATCKQPRACTATDCEPSHMKNVSGISTPGIYPVHQVSFQSVRNCWNSLLHNFSDTEQATNHLVIYT